MKNNSTLCFQSLQHAGESPEFTGKDIAVEDGKMNLVRADWQTRATALRVLRTAGCHRVMWGKQVVVLTNIDYYLRRVLWSSDEILDFFRPREICYVAVEDEAFLENLRPVQQLVRPDQFERGSVFSL